ncbi:hypothetical protein TDB9533_03004 [Thalassocella blandensis]|nr:hypothetical protein TDB9533_03004 [Thalassocella blandensis]
MLVLNQILYDRFGRKFKLHFSGDGPIPKKIKPKVFFDLVSTRSFLANLRVGEWYWQKLSYHLIGDSPYSADPFYYLDTVARLLIQGRIKLFVISDMQAEHHSVEKRIFKQRNGMSYQIVTPVALITNPGKTTKKFTSKKEAVQFVRSLSLGEENLNDLVRAFKLELPIDNTLNGKQESLIASIGDAVMEEKVLFFEEIINNPPISEVVYEDVDVKSVPLGPETDVVQIKVLAKIDAEYRVVLFDKSLTSHQGPSEEKVQTGATEVELWLDQDISSPVFDQGANISLSGPGKIQAFLDKDLTTEVNLDEPILCDKITGGKKLKIWVKGKSPGKFKIKVTPLASSNGKFLIQPPAELEMGVVELMLEVYEQDTQEIAKIKVDPDQEPITKYHTDLEAVNFPPQIVLSDENKIKKGRVLHVQHAGNFGRSKVVVKALVESQFPRGYGNCQLTLSSGGKSGSVKLFDSEFDGREVSLPLNLNKADLTIDKIYWVEGAVECNALRETRLDLGLSVGGKPTMRNGDWACFTVVKIAEVGLDIVTSTGKAEVWDKARNRFYVNLDGTEDARKLKSKPSDRNVKVKAKLTKKISGVKVHFCLVPDKRNWDKTHWGANLINFEFSKVERGLKQIDKIDRKDLTHLFANTDADGSAELDSLVLSRIGGDVFKLGAYLGQDAHLAKFVDGHTTLSKREPIFSADSIEIWRKYHIQNTYNKNIALPSRALTRTSFEKCFIEIQEVDENKYDPATIGGLVEHELWQFDMSGSTRKVVCVGDINKAKFTSLFKAPTDTTKPKAHMVMCDVQWDSDMGSSQDFAFSSRISSINYKNRAGNSYLGVFDPPLGGGAIVQSPSKWAWNDGSKMHQGRLDDTNISIEKSRGHYSEVKIELPATCPASCPCGSPGTLIVPTAARKAIVRVKLKAATGPWAGESGGVGNPQCLIVVDSNLNRFNNTIAHEIGHLFKSVRKDTGWKGIPDHPDQYIRRGGQGSHCKENATEHASRVDQNGDKIYVGGTCVMYHVAVGNNTFCDNCSADLRVRDISDIFKD